VTGHLTDEESDFARPGDRSAPRLARQREVVRRVRILIGKIASGPIAIRWACLRNLEATFREHVALVESG
jgi:hypothetical protein